MNRWIAAAAAMLISLPALAKVTFYTGADALKHVLASAQLAKAAETLPANYDLASAKVEAVPEKNAFKISFVYAPTKGPGGACTIVADVEAERTNTGGLIASHLGDPVVKAAQCNIGAP